MVDIANMVRGLILEGDIDQTEDVEEIESNGLGTTWQVNPQGRK